MRYPAQCYKEKEGRSILIGGKNEREKTIIICRWYDPLARKKIQSANYYN